MLRAIGSHHSARSLTDEWLTPPQIISALGLFDLDPCAPSDPPWRMAEYHYTVWEDGLRKKWFGRVWLNPPYTHITHWMARLAKHGTGSAIVFARTETAWWHDYIWPYASAVFFLRGRLHFHRPDGSRAKQNAGGPHALVAYGSRDAATLEQAELDGKFIWLKEYL